MTTNTGEENKSLPDGKKSLPDGNKPKQTVEERFADNFATKVISALENNNAPWQKPWKAGVIDTGPMNGNSGNNYSGVNAVMLEIEKLSENYKHNVWLTMKQANALGGSVKPKSQGVGLMYYQNLPFYKSEGYMKRNHISVSYENRPVSVYAHNTDDGTAVLKDTRLVNAEDLTITMGKKSEPEKQVVFHGLKEAEKRIGGPTTVRSFTVFNLDQIEGLDMEKVKTHEVNANAVQLDDASINNKLRVMADGLELDNGVKFGGNRAAYQIAKDGIVMPDSNTFQSQSALQATLGHEMIHATGAEKRMNRTFGMERDDPMYAREELRAEIGSWMLGKKAGIPHEPDAQHAAYVKHWVQALKDNPQEIVQATRDADKAVNYMLERGLAVEQKQEAVVSLLEKQMKSNQKITIDRMPPPADAKTNVILKQNGIVAHQDAQRRSQFFVSTEKPAIAHDKDLRLEQSVVKSKTNPLTIA